MGVDERYYCADGDIAVSMQQRRYRGPMARTARVGRVGVVVPEEKCQELTQSAKQLVDLKDYVLHSLPR